MPRRCGEAVAPLERRVAIEHVLEVPPVKMKTVPGFDTAVFPYTTDIPFLQAWGEPLLFGPGSIHVAHTADEWVSIAELEAAAAHYVTLASALSRTRRMRRRDGLKRPARTLGTGDRSARGIRAPSRRPARSGSPRSIASTSSSPTSAWRSR